MGLYVPHRKQITPPLQAQQVNAIYRFAKWNINIFGHYQSSCPLFNITFRRLSSLSP
jgi:hypothetical protein